MGVEPSILPPRKFGFTGHIAWDRPINRLCNHTAKYIIPLLDSNKNFPSQKIGQSGQSFYVSKQRPANCVLVRGSDSCQSGPGLISSVNYRMEESNRFLKTRIARDEAVIMCFPSQIPEIKAHRNFVMVRYIFTPHAQSIIPFYQFRLKFRSLPQS
jgi:hypothetical protein